MSASGVSTAPAVLFELIKEEEHSKLENSYSFLSLPRPRRQLPRNYSAAIVLSGHGMEFAPLLRHGACEVAVATRALWRSGHFDLDNEQGQCDRENRVAESPEAVKSALAPCVSASAGRLRSIV